MRRGAAALVAITILAYLPALSAGFVWDDDSYVEQNRTLTSAHGLWQIWVDPAATPQYYPLVHTTFWVEAHLWGVRTAAPFHVVNVLLHATSAVLLWRLSMRLGEPVAAEAATPVGRAAWLAAAVWAAHPVNVESVAWVTERKNVLSAVFYLSAFHAYLTAEQKPRMYIRGYAAALGLFALALLSKTVTATLPAVILVVTWWRVGRLRWRDVWPLVPFFVLGGLAGAFTGHLERTHVGAAGPEFAFTVADRVLIAGRAAWFYAAKLAVPWPLAFVYPRWTVDPRKAWQWAFPLGVVAMIVGLWLARRRVGRGPLAGVLVFVGTLTPALGFANVLPMRYSFVADHFQYLASVGLIVPTATLVRRRWVGGLWVAVLATLTFARCFAYTDRVTLWTDTVAKNPTSWMAHAQLAQAYTAAGRSDEASAQVRTELAAAPDLPDALVDAAAEDAGHGRFDRAMAESDRAVATGPAYPPAWVQRSKLLLHAGLRAEAEAAARRAVGVAPRFAPARRTLAAVLEDRRSFATAAEQWAALGDLYAAAGLPADAADCYRRAKADGRR